MGWIEIFINKWILRKEEKEAYKRYQDREQCLPILSFSVRTPASLFFLTFPPYYLTKYFILLLFLPRYVWVPGGNKPRRNICPSLNTASAFQQMTWKWSGSWWCWSSAFPSTLTWSWVCNSPVYFLKINICTSSLPSSVSSQVTAQIP